MSFGNLIERKIWCPWEKPNFFFIVYIEELLRWNHCTHRNEGSLPSKCSVLSTEPENRNLSAGWVAQKWKIQNFCGKSSLPHKNNIFIFLSSHNAEHYAAIPWCNILLCFERNPASFPRVYVVYIFQYAGAHTFILLASCRFYLLLVWANINHDITLMTV